MMAALSFEEQAETLDKVITLATTFSTCVEAFGLIHASRSSECPQKLALTRLGIEQGRLLIFGDVVGISSPPRTIATHMIPSNPGALNPDPNEPVNFGERDARLEESEIRKKVEAALNEILDRPSTLSRDEMMEKYGLKPPKKQSLLTESALDTTRLEAFREKYGLLQDLHGQTLRSRRGMSMTTQHWNITDVTKFESFVQLVRQQVDALISLMNVQDRVNRGMSIDIKAMGWHPDLHGPIVRRDWEKLKLISEACKHDYPAYVESTQVALNYLNRTWKEVYRPPTNAPQQHAPLVPKAQNQMPTIRIASAPAPKEPAPAATSGAATSVVANGSQENRRPSWLKSLFGGKDKKNKSTNTIPSRLSLSAASTNEADTQRSKSVDVQTTQLFNEAGLTQQRSKSLSTTEKPEKAVHQEVVIPASELKEVKGGVHTPEKQSMPSARHDSPLDHKPPVPNLASFTTSNSSATQPASPIKVTDHAPGANSISSSSDPIPIRTNNATAAGGGENMVSASETPPSLRKVDTVNSLIERHDMFQGLGRTETKDVRAVAHGWR